MPNYFRLIIFHFLCILDGLLNLIFSFVALYPRFDISMWFWDKTGYFAAKKMQRDVKKYQEYLAEKARRMIKEARGEPD